MAAAPLLVGSIRLHQLTTPLNNKSKSRQEVKRVEVVRGDMEGLAPLNTLFSLADSHNRAIITNLPCRPIRMTVCVLKRLISATAVKVLHTGDRRSDPRHDPLHFKASLELTPVLGSECRSLVLMKLAKQRSGKKCLICLLLFPDLSKENKDSSNLRGSFKG